MRALIIATLLALTGCATTAQIETVVVDKPIMTCPKPPTVPVIEYKVDSLTEADIKTPGAVGEAYKYDMTALRVQNRIYRQILDEYSRSSMNFDAVNAEIDKLYKHIGVVQKPINTQ